MRRRPPLFVYGSLLDGELRRALLGAGGLPRRVEAAVMPGARVAEGAHPELPVLIEAAGRSVRGELLHGLSLASLGRLAAYEGPGYRLEVVRVEVAGRPLPATCFRWRGAVPAGADDWSLERWRRKRKRALLGALAHRSK